MTNTRTGTARRRLALTAATAALAGGLALPAAPAAAAPAGTAERMAPAAAADARGTAPACVRRDVVKHRKKVTVTNTCGRTMHVKVVINRGRDLRCLTYRHGQTWTGHWRIGSYGKVVTC
ncbi:hypothetical protein DMH02_029795 [Streptomyces sp. WAC 00631]|uniref:hypothetical protein n=1 Tax=unclassified Streptomyces TaxID=2593676 RepID=UPI000F767F36|nr:MULTISPECIES: hypothetical protein [unclassified Streptomyces]MCC5037256.1 hypothetical protein [Streptomyces sp. WAC 00631]MCC9737856.1 hypothetical protein [Streptomyces sp. MNU89]